MPHLDQQELEQREGLAQLLLDQGADPADLETEPEPGATATLSADLGIPFPAGLAPVPQPISPAPSPDDQLPGVDVVVITWTVAEVNALADVFTPGKGRNSWYRYARNFETEYKSKIREGAPAQNAQRLGSYFPVQIGGTSVLAMKSELHMARDGVSTGDGTATLPVKDFFAQIIAEAKPKLLMTIGTSGGTASAQNIGDACMTRAARFRLAAAFGKEPWNHKTFKSEWDLPTSQFEAGEKLMARYADRLVEPTFSPPTVRYGYDGPPLENKPPNVPKILRDGEQMKAFDPVLTTDFFEFGTSTNHLEKEGCAVEMGDAVLGLLCSELDDAPNWLVIRNLSDPQINGELPTEPPARNMQTHWAVWYYEQYGYWTSVCGALAAWSVVAGFDQEH